MRGKDAHGRGSIQNGSLDKRGPADPKIKGLYLYFFPFWSY